MTNFTTCQTIFFIKLYSLKVFFLKFIYFWRGLFNPLPILDYSNPYSPPTIGLKVGLLIRLTTLKVENMSNDDLKGAYNRTPSFNGENYA